KDPAIGGRKRTGLYFAGAVIRKSFVGFYFMPRYSNHEFVESLPSELKKWIKGKACFDIRKAGEALFEQIERMTREGLGCTSGINGSGEAFPNQVARENLI